MPRSAAEEAANPGGDLMRARQQDVHQQRLYVCIRGERLELALYICYSWCTRIYLSLLPIPLQQNNVRVNSRQRTTLGTLQYA